MIFSLSIRILKKSQASQGRRNLGGRGGGQRPHFLPRLLMKSSSFGLVSPSLMTPSHGGSPFFVPCFAPASNQLPFTLSDENLLLEENAFKNC